MKLGTISEYFSETPVMEYSFVFIIPSKTVNMSGTLSSDLIVSFIRNLPRIGELYYNLLKGSGFGRMIRINPDRIPNPVWVKIRLLALLRAI